MATMEDLIMGLFGGLDAPGAEDELRRRRGPASGGYEGLAGPQVTANSLRALIGGLPQYDFSGAMGRDFGRGGLASLMAGAGQEPGRGLSGPALRHFMNQGFDFNPPGLDNRNAPGGPNIAPGNIENARALDQPMANPTPGVPRGVGLEQAPGQVAARPQTQGWRNIHPGYSAAAQFGYGTPEFEQNLGIAGGGRQVGAPAAGVSPPGGQPGGGGGRPGGGGGGGGGGAPQSQNAVGGGGAPVAPGAGPGAGQGSTGGGSAGGKQTGGAGGGGGTQNRGGVGGVSQGDVIGIQQGSTTGRPAGVNKQGEFSQQRFKRDARDIRNNDPTQAFGNTIHIVPNQGNNNTPSETGGGQSWNDTHTGLYQGETNAETKARLAAKAARQEAARQAAAPPASNFGSRAQGGLGTPTLVAPLSESALEKAANRGRGSGTAPIAGKTKPKPGTNSSGFQRGQR